MSNKHTMSFQTEVKQLLNLMIHSLYSDKEIFLRELISNASDAIDKFRFLQISKPELSKGEELVVNLSFDKDAKTITITDNGIGMNYDEVVENIGTIAKSGTKAFLDGLTGDAKKDANLIGQFGVGFYSSFIVADKVELITLKAGDTTGQAVQWVSDGAGEFTIEKTVKLDGHGTTITLHLKAEQDDLLSDWGLRNVIHKYSDHINYPIKMLKTPEYDKDGKAIEATELETVNKANALWTRSKNDISEEEYKEFYKHVSHDYNEPMKWIHAKVEGAQEYTQLLYIPGKAPFDLYDAAKRYGIKLYVKRVFIMDDAEKLLPNYLRFVRGVIDSQDLPLNVSREILQNSRDIDAIRSGSTKKVLSLLEDIAKDGVEYQKLWNEFGPVIKEGIIEDHANKERVAKLCRFASSANESNIQNVSLDDYINRMKDGQDKIYYITAESYNGAKNSPHLEIFKQKDIEVLLLSDRVDEWMVSHLFEFDKKSLVSVAKGKLDLGNLDDNKPNEEEQKAQDEKAGPIIEKIKQALNGSVKEVIITSRLVDSPACLVVENNAMSIQMERLLRQAGQEVPNNKPTLEINLNHKLIYKLDASVDQSQIEDLSFLILDEAKLAEGIQLEDPVSFVRRVNSFIA